jgi:hypothetical protein
MQKWAGVVAQVVQHLPSKCDALRSNPSTAKKNSRHSVLEFNVPLQKNVRPIFMCYHKKKGPNTLLKKRTKAISKMFTGHLHLGKTYIIHYISRFYVTIYVNACK